MANKPDFTAWFVLQGLIAAMHQKAFKSESNNNALQYLIPLSKEASKQRTLSWLIYALPYSWQYAIGNFTTNPDRLRHFFLRKQEIEKQTRQALLQGEIKQVVVLGAGLDVLPLYLAPEYPDVQFIEIDLPASQQFKLEAFKAHAITPPSNVQYIEGDFRNPLSEILNLANYDTNSKTLWIAEGLLMFLSEKTVIGMFKEIVTLCTSNSLLIFTTFSSGNKLSKFSLFLQSYFLRKEHCPYNWVILSKDVAKFLEKSGLLIVKQLDCHSILKDGANRKIKENQLIGDDIHIART